MEKEGNHLFRHIQCVQRTEFKWQQEEIRLDIAKLISSADGEHLATTSQPYPFGQATTTSSLIPKWITVKSRFHNA